MFAYLFLGYKSQVELWPWYLKRNAFFACAIIAGEVLVSLPDFSITSSVFCITLSCEINWFMRGFVVCFPLIIFDFYVEIYWYFGGTCVIWPLRMTVLEWIWDYVVYSLLVPTYLQKRCYNWVSLIKFSGTEVVPTCFYPNKTKSGRKLVVLYWYLHDLWWW